MPYARLVKCIWRRVPAALLIAFLGAVGLLAPTTGVAQAIVTFDDWVLPCAAADGCTGGGLIGPETAFEILGGAGFVCAEGRCLEAIWPSSSTTLRAQVAFFTPPRGERLHPGAALLSTEPPRPPRYRNLG